MESVFTEKFIRDDYWAISMFCNPKKKKKTLEMEL